MYPPFSQALTFLISTLINLYFFSILLRFLFTYFHIDKRNPFFPFILKITDPVWVPLQKGLPQYSKFDLTPVVLLCSLKCVEFLLISLINRGILPGLTSLIIWTLGESMSQIINVFFLAVLMVAILSWFQPRAYSPFTEILVRMTEPLMMPARRLIPSGLGIDLSPLFVLITLKLIDILLAHPLMQLGLKLSFQ